MHRGTMLLLVGAMALALAPAAAGAKSKATASASERQSYELRPVDGRRFLLIDNVQGSVTVRAGAAGDRVELELTKRFRADSDAELERAKRETKLTVEAEPGRLALIQDGPFRCDRAEHRYLCRESREDLRWEAIFDWVVTVPADLDLEVRTVNEGKVAIDGVTGRIEAANVNGGIELREVAGQVSAMTVNGGVSATFRALPTGDLSFQSVNGELDLAFPSGFGALLSAQTLNGEVWTDFDFQTVAARREPTGSGRRQKLSGSSLRLGAGGPKLDCQTVNGDILIREKG
ncbi:MAG: hypothetical protein H6511_06760 [Holophagales bacterium]|nr:hypothetical protein [Holophagales bacterium]